MRGNVSLINVGKAELQTAPQPQLKESAAIRLKRLQAVQRALGPRRRSKSAADLGSAATQNKAAPAWTRINLAGARSPQWKPYS